MPVKLSSNTLTYWWSKWHLLESEQNSLVNPPTPFLLGFPCWGNYKGFHWQVIGSKLAPPSTFLTMISGRSLVCNSQALALRAGIPREDTRRWEGARGRGHGAENNLTRMLGPGLTPCEPAWEAQPRGISRPGSCQGSCAQMLPCYEIISRPQWGERVGLLERSIPLGGFSGV